MAAVTTNYDTILAVPFWPFPLEASEETTLRYPLYDRIPKRYCAMWGEGGGWISNWAAKVVGQEPRKSGKEKAQQLLTHKLFET